MSISTEDRIESAINSVISRHNLEEEDVNNVRKMMRAVFRDDRSIESATYGRMIPPETLSDFVNEARVILNAADKEK